MLEQVVANTNIIMFLMIGVGVIGILAKAINQITLRRMVRAAGSMSKSTHKLIKLVRAKYEHACMAHDTVENVDAFVDKYIYEYRSLGLRIHTWRQLEIQSIWFAGILAVIGAAGQYLYQGFSEQVYQYLAVGAVEMVVLFVISQLSDESYKINMAKNYMVDYLENVCSHRLKKTKQSEKEQLDVITQESSKNVMRAAAKKEEPPLSINIEGEPRKAEKEEAAKQVIRRSVKEKMEEEEQPVLKEEAIRQILEEFLA